MTGLPQFLLPLVSISLWMWMLFAVKHLIADFLLQNSWIVLNKGKYLHPAGWVHAGIHGVLTGLVLGFIWLHCPIPVDLNKILIMTFTSVLVEIVLHQGIDWVKCQFAQSFRLTPSDSGFWWAIGIDQFAHLMTYWGIAVYFWMILLGEIPSTKIMQF